jgi:circadian clock protein KaiB
MSRHPLGGGPHPLLRLYVAGETPGARRALESRRRLLEALNGKVDIEIIDILAKPSAAETAGILATPTLSDESVSPPRRLIGDISNIAQVLDYFGYRKKDSAP